MTHERKLGFSEVDERRRKKTRLAVHDFNTLGDLVDHAARDLGATHVSGAGPTTKLYFPRGGTHPYEEAKVSRRGGYWHAEGPGARTGVKKLPAGAEALGRGQRRAAAPRPQVARDYIAVDSRGRTLAGPFKSYSDAKHAAGLGGNVEYVRETGTAGVFEVDEGPGIVADRPETSWEKWKRAVINDLEKSVPRLEATKIFDRYRHEMAVRFRNGDSPSDTAHNFLNVWQDEPLKEARPRPKAKRSAARRR